MFNPHVTTSLAQGALVAGKYRLLKQLGEGAMGVVWAARNEHTLGHVALKLILGPGSELRLQLLREAQACCKIQHKNVIQIHDVGQTDDGDPFLVMELLSGETLAELLGRARRLNSREAAVIGRDIARALGAAHDKGIVHRDLEPANIFLHNQPGEDMRVVKVLDFGLSKNLLGADGLGTLHGVPPGSAAYMSPEQARAERDIDARADIWSLGVVLFEMLTGERPFRGEAEEVIDRILNAEIPLASCRVRSVDPGLDRLILACLTRDREQRLWSIAEVERGLGPFTVDLPRSRVPTLPGISGVNPAASSPQSSRSRLDAQAQKLEVAILSAARSTPLESPPRAIFLPNRPLMFSSTAPVIAGVAAVNDAESPASATASWTGPTPFLEKVPRALMVARAVVACVVAVVVLILSFTHAPSRPAAPASPTPMTVVEPSPAGE